MERLRKYSDLAPPNASPTLAFNLPELQYPDHLNAVQAVFDGARDSGWTSQTVFFANDETWSFERVEKEVGRYATGLKALDIGIGDRVILRIPDTIELVVALLAVQAIGGIAVPTYTQLRIDDLVYRAKDADAKLIVCSTELLGEALRVPSATNDRTGLVALPADPEGRCRNLADHMPERGVKPEYADTHAEELCLFLYTSGSTGAPKGTVHCHRDMLAIADSYWRYSLAPTSDDVMAGPPSIAFALGFGMYVYFPLRLGHAAVLEPDKSPEKSIEIIEKYRVTIFAGVVSYYNVLARLIRETNADVSSIVHPMTGGEPLTEEIERGWLDTTGVPIEQFIGTTEMLHCFVTSTRPDGPPQSRTMGHAVPGYEVTVVDPDTFEELPDGEQGLFATRGPTGTVYWNKPDHQTEVVRDGWNVFQDVVWRDEQGNFHYVARHDEMIISSGYNISPVQVENVLMQHPAVHECACVPAPDPSGRRGSVVKAYIVTSEEADAGDALAEELQNYVKNNAPPYMYPRLISFEVFLPKTINGKILRSELRARAS